MATNKKVLVTVPPDLYDWVEEQAIAENNTIANMIQTILIKLKRKEDEGE